MNEEQQTNGIEKDEEMPEAEPQYEYHWRYDEQRLYDEQERKKSARRGAIVFACIMAATFLIALGVLVGTLVFRNTESTQPSKAETTETHPTIGIVGGTIQKDQIFSYREKETETTYQSPADGVLVMTVTEGSGADGVLSPGDVIVAIDGKTVSSIEELIEKLYDYKAGDTVTLQIYRLGKTQPTNVKVKLGAAN